MRKILIVDDNKINRLMLRAMLEKDYGILEAENGAVALDILRREAGDISAVLLDISMPVMDGYEMLRKAREDSALPTVPIIIVTGNEDETSRVKALSLGANDFLMKPYNGDILHHCLVNNITLYENAALVWAAQFDDLTGLYNRKTFFTKAAEMIAAHEPGYYVMACFDVDRFKVVNDQYGTDRGDEVLRHIADAFRNGFEPEGGICCRISGDNFAVLYPRSFIDSERLASIRRTAATPAGFVTPIRFSIGRYIVDDLTLAVSAMYDRATLAEESAKGLYDANIALYDESMRGRLLHEQKLVTEMRSALEDNQFEAWLQPQYNHASGALIGAEALVRWRRADGTLVTPGEFIPVFERNGFIYEVDKYIWEQVCIVLRKWLDEGRDPLPVSVNISRLDIFREDFFNIITGLLEAYRIPVELLRLEITESAFATGTEQIVSMVKRLIAYGFTVEIDDFGSGYSSLNTLKDVPAQVLKLDMKFLENTDDSQRGGNILSSIARMSQWLGMTVIAEGVETREQADFLKTIGCNYVQGYLYARPMPVMDYEALAKKIGKEREMPRLQTVDALDNNTFWEPSSMDALIFNSYVGGAGICEYYDGHIELLRINDNYIREMGIVCEQDQPLSAFDLANYTNEIGKSRLAKIADLAISTNKEQTCEIEIPVMANRFPQARDLRVTVRAIARAENRYLLYSVISNVTEQRRAERAQLASARQLAAIMENINGGVTATIYRDGRMEYLFSNERYYEILGCSREEYEDRFSGGLLLVHPEDMARVAEASAKASREKKSYSVDYRILRPNGEIRWLRSNVSLMDFPDIAEPVQLTVIIDITEHRLLEQKERETAERLQAILANINGAVVMSVIRENKADILFANNRYYELYGYTKEEYEEAFRDSVGPIHEEDAKWVLPAIEKVMSTGEACKLDFRAYSRDGSEVWVRDRIIRLNLTEFEQPVQLSVLYDITEEIRLEQAEREHVKAITQMVQDMPGGYVKMRITPTGVVPVFMNNEFCRLCGMSLDEAMGMYAKDAYAGVHPDDLEYTGSVISDAIAKRATLSLRIRLSSGSGGYVPVQVFYRVTEDPSGIYLNGYYTNATETNIIEEQRRELLENLPCGAGIYEITNGGIHATYLNKQYRAYLKRDISDLSTAPVFEVVHPEDIGKLKIALQKALSEDKEGMCDIRIMDGTGGYIPFHMVGRIIEQSRDKTAVYVTYTPITEKELLLHRRAEMDGMTGVYNKTTAETIIRERLSGTGHIPCAMLIVDVDDLKTINDTLGHPQGDKAICFVADALKEQFRKTDIIGRIGGDEFIVFLEGVKSRKKLKSMANDLLTGLSKAAGHGTDDLQTPVSIGIAEGTEGEVTFEELYDKADKALYSAKANGKNRFAFFLDEP